MSSTAAAGSPSVDVGGIIDASRVQPLHYGVFALCALCMIMDGFDVQALGYVAPAIIAEWKIAPALLGPVFGASNLGVLIGQLSFTVVADRVGRRPVLVLSTIAFAILTILTGLVHSTAQLLAMRLIAGMALGSIIPNATALISELTPTAARVRFVTYISVGFTAGAVIGGLIAAWLIPTYGWRSVFYVGGVAPLVIAALMARWLPESLRLLVIRRKRADYVARWIVKLDPALTVDSTTKFVLKEESKRGAPVRHLMTSGRAVVTVLFWIIFFMNLFNLYSLANWLPTVVRGAGYDTRTAVLVGTMLQVGGTVSPFVLTWLVMRKGFIRVLTFAFAVAAVSIALIGQPASSLAMLVAIVFVAGGCVVGSQPSLNALAAAYYPTYLRSTGVGWALGIGRAGSIVGPVIAGLFLSWKWTTEDIFFVLAIPAAISAVAVFMLQWAIGEHEAASPHVSAAAAASAH